MFNNTFIYPLIAFVKIRLMCSLIFSYEFRYLCNFILVTSSIYLIQQKIFLFSISNCLLGEEKNIIMSASQSKSYGFKSHSQHIVTLVNRVLLVRNCRQRQVTIHKIIQYYQFQAHIPFPYLLKRSKNWFALMGYRVEDILS